MVHTLGITGNYAIPGYLQRVASSYNLSIQYLGDAGYKITADNNGLNINQLCPNSIERSGDIFDVKNLRKFLEFLHQPIKASIAYTIPDAKKSFGFCERVKQNKEKDVRTHKERVAIHRLLRFATTGTVSIPPDHYDSVEKYAEDDHAKTEQAMRDEDAWRTEVEFGNQEPKSSSIPQTTFDLQKGFRLSIDDTCLGSDRQGGSYQKELYDKFWFLINTATKGRYTFKNSDVYLSGEELECFCHAAKQEDIGQLIDGVEFEEAVQVKLQSIEKRTSDLSQSFVFADLTAGEGDKTDQLKKLMACTTALTPVMSSQFMRDAWTRYNFTQRHASPMEGLGKEFSTFMAVAALYAQQDQVSPLQMEAIATEFYSLLGFSTRMIAAIDDGLEKEEIKNPNNPKIEEIRQGFSSVKAVFNTASISGFSLNPQFMSEGQRTVLDTFEKHAGRVEPLLSKAKSASSVPFKAAGKATINFAADVVHFIKEDPKIAVGFIGLAAALILMNGEDPSVALQAAEYSQGLMVGDDGEFIETAVNASSVPKDLFGNDNFHWDLKLSPLRGYELYKHFANSNFIVGPSLEFIEFLRSSIHSAYGQLGIPQNYQSVCDATATSVVEPLANKLFAINMLQNVSHAAFWLYTGSRGYHHGLKGFGKLFELAAPVTDLGYQMVDTAWKFRQKTALSEQLVYAADKQDLFESLSDAAELRVELEDSLPEGVETFVGTLNIDAIKTPKKWDGLKREFQIGAHNLRPVLKALNQFDYFMQHVGPQIAMQESWHLNTLSVCLTAVKAALRDYQKNGDGEALGKALDDNLESVLAAEMRYRGGVSGVYNALFEMSPDADALKRLVRSANTSVSRERKKHSKTELYKGMRAGDGTSLTLGGHVKARTKILGINLWGGMVEAARGLRRGSEKVVNKQSVIIGSGLAASCVGIDLAGLGNEFSDAVSGLTCGATASGTTVTTFLHFNFWEDIVGVHLGTGTGLIITGAAAGYAHKRLVKPAVMYGLEGPSLK